MNKTKKCRFKKQTALQKTRSNKQSLPKRQRLNEYVDITKVEKGDVEEGEDYDGDNILSNMSKRFWSLFGY